MKHFFLLLIIFCYSSILFAQQDYNKYLSLDYIEIDSMMELYYSNGAFSEAIPLMNAGRAKSEKEYGKQDTLFAFYCAWGGFLHSQLGAYDKENTLNLVG